MSSHEDWARAYARQARADFASYEILAREDNVPTCQSLHFLQMACEKLAKAHLCREKSDPRKLQSSHAYIAKVLPTIAKQLSGQAGGRVPKPAPWVLRRVADLAREIELLAPSIDDGGRRPENCEYPWEDANGTLHIPAEHEFTNLNLLGESAGRSLLKVIEKAIDRLAG